MSEKLVTKSTLVDMLNDPRLTQHVIGRACVALFKRQTVSERASNTTKVENGIGFTGQDARSGSLTAKYYMKHGSLEQWMVDRWMKPGTNGLPRICKYDRQLSEIAAEKAAEKGISPSVKVTVTDGNVISLSDVIAATERRAA